MSNSPNSELTQGAVEVWASLPEGIRCDQSFVPFHEEHERIKGRSDAIIENPQPNESMPSQSENILNGSYLANNEFTTINLGGRDENNKNQLENGVNNTSLLDCHNASSTVHKAHITGANSPKSLLNKIKIALLVIVWILFTVSLMCKDEKILDYHQVAIPADRNKSYILNEIPMAPRFNVIVYGSFADDNSNTTNSLQIQAQLIHDHIEDGNNHSSESYTAYHNDIFKIPIVDVSAIETAKTIRKSFTFSLDPNMFEQIGWNDTVLSLQIATNLPIAFSINLAYDPAPIDKSLGIIYAAIILLSLYVMIIWEIIDRTFAAMLASTLSIGILALMNERPTMPEILSWIDVETLLLLFGMMILVGILSETGLFDYLAVYAFKITRGKIWPLVYCLCLFTAFLSAILDNVTTLLLMGPVSIRLCEIMQLNPVPILMSMIFFSNIGGAMTPVGDPPNIIIASNSHVLKNGVNFLNFTIHMSVGAILVMIQSYIQLRLKFRNISDLRIKESQDVEELRSDIAAWQRAESSLSSHSSDADIVREILAKKINRLKRELKEKLTTGSISSHMFNQTLQDLQKKYPIRNYTLLIKSVVALAFVLSCFFFHSLPYIERLSLGWIALLGAILLLILADRREIESVLARVEWTTLLFFAVLFVLMESLVKLGLIEWIGIHTENVILSVGKEYQLTVAILIVVWVSAIASAFVDNIPLTTMMIKIVISLSEHAVLNLPLQPLVWSLSFGACLGGNGTLIGASANIVAASVAEQHGYRITFKEFFKVAFPTMIGSLVVASGYLVICHVFFTWHI